MKTISIPTYNNPFIVKINNNEYIYKGGETIEVPDEVAEAIENSQEVRDALATPKIITGGSTLVVEANEDRTKIVTPLNAIRDAWMVGRPIILPLSQNGYTNIFNLVSGGVGRDNGDFKTAQFVRISETGIEIYSVDEKGNLAYTLSQ